MLFPFILAISLQREPVGPLEAIVRQNAHSLSPKLTPILTAVRHIKDQVYGLVKEECYLE
jgi:hypothetical protein